MSQRLVTSMFSLSALMLGLLISAPSQAAPPPQKAKPAAAPASRPASSAPRTGRPAAVGKAPVSKELTEAYKRYVEAMKPKIYQGWYEKVPFGKHHVVLSVTIQADGQLGDLNLNSTPKSGEAEQAANDGLNAAQPLSPLPAGSPPCRLVITMDSTGSPPADFKTNFAIKMDPVAGAAAASPNVPQSAPEPSPTEAKADDSKPAEAKPEESKPEEKKKSSEL